MTRALIALTVAASALLAGSAASARPDIPESPFKIGRGGCPSGYSEIGWVGTNHEYRICQR